MAIQDQCGFSYCSPIPVLLNGTSFMQLRRGVWTKTCRPPLYSLVYMQNRWQSRCLQLLIRWLKRLENWPDDKVPLIKCWNLCTHTLYIFSIILFFINCQLAEWPSKAFATCKPHLLKFSQPHLQDINCAWQTSTSCLAHLREGNLAC